MNFYLDCEFDGWMGSLISLALVSEDGDEFYWRVTGGDVGWVKDPWVRDNVIPVLTCPGASATHLNLSNGIAEYLARSAQRANAHIIVDWPDDVAYFCRAMIVGPGARIDTPPLTFEVTRYDAYPTDLEGAVQHNALWDARALRHHIKLLRAREDAQ